MYKVSWRSDFDISIILPTRYKHTHRQTYSRTHRWTNMYILIQCCTVKHGYNKPLKMDLLIHSHSSLYSWRQRRRNPGDKRISTLSVWICLNRVHNTRIFSWYRICFLTTFIQIHSITKYHCNNTCTCTCHNVNVKAYKIPSHT